MRHHRTGRLRAATLVLGLTIVLTACDAGGIFGPPGAGAPDPAPADPTEEPTDTPSEEPTGDPGTEPPAGDPPADPPAEEPEAPEGYELVWSDEFDGDEVDTSKWRVRDNDYADYDRACITDSDQNVFVEDGILTLRARREAATCGSQQRDYTTAYLDTIGKASFTYGRFEVRAKSPNGPDNSRGLWPAFWMRPDDGGNGEIDIVELNGGPLYHNGATLGIHYTYEPGVKQTTFIPFETGHPADGFHTYTTEWEPDALRWYIDGELVYERTPSTTPWFDDAFSRPYHLRLNFQVGGWLGDPDANTELPADFEVDYVRVWQR